MILLTGSTGQVGSALVQALAPFGRVVAPTRAELDLVHPASVREFVRKVNPRWIVNPAAYTAVDKAESETAQAYAVNAELPRILGEEAAQSGAAVIHFSTDYIFDGEGTLPYTEKDIPAPHSIYGSTKLEGERALAATGAAHLIFRTSWVYGATGKNFLLTILNAAKARPELRIVADQHGAPTWSRDLARLTNHAIARAETLANGRPLPEALQPLSGVYHACAAGETTWFGFAQAAVEHEQQRDPAQKLATLTPITTAEYPTPARRPANSRMDTSKLGSLLGFHFPQWQDSLNSVLAELHL
ncbi:dTDP-4-dehydrorhamnose reductase [Granulicella tundricola]|uniref:dTDP-4-dehydrorhamnose reductase n=1 Tax=Granulicella tundricola (strain ATCC BAA-1859 / DSM 23138 / MP5ACTX9) TaxID=1198114 RepID=E8WW47_GRATM|nr:dTDP-4-dehydrorhamnose reductase [Granulicella tundricola]ADW67353.1 dTDP-4-dehydrorhamnose reductase [Granulicella tundricola MP5ACTX9]